MRQFIGQLDHADRYADGVRMIRKPATDGLANPSAGEGRDGIQAHSRIYRRRAADQYRLPDEIKVTKAVAASSSQWRRPNPDLPGQNRSWPQRPRPSSRSFEFAPEFSDWHADRLFHSLDLFAWFRLTAGFFYELFGAFVDVAVALDDRVDMLVSEIERFDHLGDLFSLLEDHHFACTGRRLFRPRGGVSIVIGQAPQFKHAVRKRDLNMRSSSKCSPETSTCSLTMSRMLTCLAATVWPSSRHSGVPDAMRALLR